MVIDVSWNPYPGSGSSGGINPPTAALQVNGLNIDASNPIPFAQASFPLINSAAGTIGTSATLMVPFSATRKWVMISNRTIGTETHDVGSANVTANGGIPIAAGGGFLFNGAGASGPIYGVTTVANSPFSYVEG